MILWQPHWDGRVVRTTAYLKTIMEVYGKNTQYTDLLRVGPISRKLKHCIINLQIDLKFLYISVLP